MKKLEDIPKKEIFTVPEGYFETLPGKIQARISSGRPVRETSFVFRYKLQYVLPVIVLLAAGVYWFSASNQPRDVDGLLATVQTEDLVAYLNDSDITTEDLLENVAFDSEDLEEIESEVYELNMNDVELDKMLNDIDLENI
jgi:hypothetical protein